MTLYAKTKAENALITNDPVSTCPGRAMVPKLGWEEVSERCGRLPAESHRLHTDNIHTVPLL